MTLTLSTSRSSCPTCTCGYVDMPHVDTIPAYTQLSAYRVNPDILRISTQKTLMKFLENNSIHISYVQGDIVFPRGLCTKVRNALREKISALGIVHTPMQLDWGDTRDFLYGRTPYVPREGDIHTDE